MNYLSEFCESLVFLLGGYAYMCNVSLKKTLVSTLNYIELVFIHHSLYFLIYFAQKSLYFRHFVQ